jgi:hypothetical protein
LANIRTVTTPALHSENARGDQARNSSLIALRMVASI